jgi:hypothetical protein
MFVWIGGNFVGKLHLIPVQAIIVIIQLPFGTVMAVGRCTVVYGCVSTIHVLHSALSSLVTAVCHCIVDGSTSL